MTRYLILLHSKYFFYTIIYLNPMSRESQKQNNPEAAALLVAKGYKLHEAGTAEVVRLGLASDLLNVGSNVLATVKRPAIRSIT